MYKKTIWPWATGLVSNILKNYFMGNLQRLFIVPFNIIRNRIFVFIFLNGFLLALLVYFFVEDNYESQIFRALASQVLEQGKTDNRSIALTSLQLTHNLEKYRLSVFGNKDINAIKSDLIRPVTFDLITGSGACGSYAYVLSRILDEFNIKTRFAQMKVGDTYGAHIVIEALIGGSWVVLDPSYNLYFQNERGELASFKQVGNNWDYFKQQAPTNYDQSYDYSGVRYTNWDKIPVVLPAIKSTLGLFKSKEEIETLSLRSFVLQKFSILFKVTLAFYVLITLFFIRAYVKQSNEIENFRLSLLFAKKSKIAIASKRLAL